MKTKKKVTNKDIVDRIPVGVDLKASAVTELLKRCGFELGKESTSSKLIKLTNSAYDCLSKASKRGYFHCTEKQHKKLMQMKRLDVLAIDRKRNKNFGFQSVSENEKLFLYKAIF